jgi:DNA-binding HxlR family transcriptional regulator
VAQLIEEQLRRIEDLLTMLLKRIEEIERLVREVDPRAPPISLASRFMLVFSMPALRALEAASTVLKLIPRAGAEDEVTRTIIEALATTEREVTISELTRMVKALRGKASRRIVAERVRRLHSKGLVSLRRSSNRVYVKLAREG